MKRILAALLVITACFMARAQQTVCFTARHITGSYLRMDSLVVKNAGDGRSWQDTLRYPDTVLVLSTSNSIDAPAVFTRVTLSCAPNPFNGEAMVTISAPCAADAIVRLLSVDGKVLAIRNIALREGSNSLTVAAGHRGVFILAVQGEGFMESKRIVCTRGQGAPFISQTEFTPGVSSLKKKSVIKSINLPYATGDTLWLSAYTRNLDGGVVAVDTFCVPANQVDTVVIVFSFPWSVNCGALPGLFSVAGDRQVRFSQGNLWYRNPDDAASPMEQLHATADGVAPGQWLFAPTQYALCDTDQSYGHVTADYTDSSSAFIDLFGWGTSGWNSGSQAYQPYATSENNADYNLGGYGWTSLTDSAAYADWGVYNAISNGGNRPGLWRTLTGDEWDYLLYRRQDASDKQGYATVNGVHGLILLPDNFVNPTSRTFNNRSTTGWTANVYDSTEWQAMEASGAVFLPAPGYRHGNVVYYVGTGGFYWSSTGTDAANASFLFIYPINMGLASDNRYGGASVRLVTDVR